MLNFYSNRSGVSNLLRLIPVGNEDAFEFNSHASWRMRHLRGHRRITRRLIRKRLHIWRVFYHALISVVNTYVKNENDYSILHGIGLE
jgi:hypothetical protein